MENHRRQGRWRNLPSELYRNIDIIFKLLNNSRLIYLHASAFEQRDPSVLSHTQRRREHQPESMSVWIRRKN